jgi:hypothetical protein
MPQDSSGPHSPKSLRTASKRLEQIAASVASAADTLEEHGVTALEVKYQASLKRGLKEFTRWMGAVEQAVNEKLDEIGAFEAAKEMEVPEESAPKKRARKRRSSETGVDEA